jgi:hypothetical protein
VKSGKRAVLAEFDPALFAPGATGTVATQDEESSGSVRDWGDVFDDH